MITAALHFKISFFTRHKCLHNRHLFSQASFSIFQHPSCFGYDIYFYSATETSQKEDSDWIQTKTKVSERIFDAQMLIMIQTESKWNIQNEQWQTD